MASAIHPFPRAAAGNPSAGLHRLEALVAAIDGIVWEGDPATFRFTFVSAQAERLLGYPASDWLTQGFWAAHIHPDDRHTAVEFCTEKSRGGVDHSFEYRMLEFLVRERARVVSKQELSDYLYPHDDDRDSNVLEVLMGRLRRKLDPTGSLAPIETLRGRGYRFTLA